MTFRELAEKINGMTEEQKDYQVKYLESYDSATIFNLTLEKTSPNETIQDEDKDTIQPNQFYLY
jgi:hypothetical protein